jgi:hypothetical protein
MVNPSLKTIVYPGILSTLLKLLGIRICKILEGVEMVFVTMVHLR